MATAGEQASDSSSDDEEAESGVEKVRSYGEVVQEAYNTDLKHIEQLRCVGVTARDTEVYS